jgi:hypothetical protein
LKINDFTKEELQYLWERVDYNCEYHSEPDIAYDTRNKLKSLIDNYEEEIYKNRVEMPKFMESIYLESLF